MKCQFCGAENPGDSKFCGVCGGNLKTASMQKTAEKSKKQFNICPFCGAQSPRDAIFCRVCGKNLNNVPAPKTYTQKWGYPETGGAGQETFAGAKPRKKKGKIIAIVSIIAAVIIIAAAVFFVLKGGGNNFSFLKGSGSEDVVLSDFAADEVYFAAGMEDTITFTVSAAGSPKSVTLYRDGESTAQMKDNGKDADETAGDGIYTAQISLENADAGQMEYSCSAGDVSGGSIMVYVFAEPSEDDEEEYKEVKASLEEIKAARADEEGDISEDDCDDLMADVDSCLKEFLEDGIILLYEIEDDTAYIKFSFGLTYIFDGITYEDTSGDGEDVTLTYIMYQPNPDLAYGQFTNITAEVADKFETTSASYMGGQVTLEVIKSLSSNTVITWNGHGGYNSNVKSYLATGEYYDWDAWEDDATYRNDCLQERIICNSTENQTDLACITYKFINRYCGDLSNDLIFLSACHSGQSEELANAFLGKGAQAVVGFTEEVYSGYAMAIQLYSLRYMTRYNKDTGHLYTLSEAIEQMKDVHGDNDIEWWSAIHPNEDVKSSVAEPRIFGGTDAEDYRLGEPDAEAMYYAELEELAQDYWIFETAQTGTMQETDDEWLNPYGIISADILDLDSDGELEMLVCIAQECDDYDYGSAYVEYSHLMLYVYEVEDGEVIEKDSMLLGGYRYNETSGASTSETSLNEALFSAKYLCMNIVETEDEKYIFCEMQSIVEGFADGSTQHYYMLEYTGEALQYVCSFSQTGGGSSDFEYTGYMFENGECVSQELYYAEYSATDALYGDDFAAAITAFFEQYDVDIKDDVSWLSFDSILSYENETSGGFIFENDLISSDTSNWSSITYEFAATLTRSSDLLDDIEE